MSNKPLSIAQVAIATGFCKAKVRSLISSGRIKATNTSTGRRPTYHVTQESLAEFLKPESTTKTEVVPERARVVMPDRSILDRIEKQLKMKR